MNLAQLKAKLLALEAKFNGTAVKPKQQQAAPARQEAEEPEDTDTEGTDTDTEDEEQTGAEGAGAETPAEEEDKDKDAKQIVTLTNQITDLSARFDSAVAAAVKQQVGDAKQKLEAEFDGKVTKRSVQVVASQSGAPLRVSPNAAADGTPAANTSALKGKARLMAAIAADRTKTK